MRPKAVFVRVKRADLRHCLPIKSLLHKAPVAMWSLDGARETRIWGRRCKYNQTARRGANSTPVSRL